MSAPNLKSRPAVDRAAELGTKIIERRELWAELPSDRARTFTRAGVDAFAERGFHGTNLRRIADGTGLSTAALYVHFASKEDLLFEICRSGFEVTEEIVGEATAIADPAEALMVLMYAFTAWQAQHHTTARVVYYESEALTPEHGAELLKIRSRVEHRVRETIQSGIDQGTFMPGAVGGTGAALLSLGVDVARWYGPHAPYTPDQLGRLYCTLGARIVGIADAA